MVPGVDLRVLTEKFNVYRRGKNEVTKKSAGRVFALAEDIFKKPENCIMNLPLSKEVLEVMQMVSRIGNGTVAFHQPPRSKKIKLYSNEAVIAFAQILLA
jgi:hypothetical protein